MIKRTLSVIAVVTMMGSVGNVEADDRGVLRDLVSRLDALELQAAPLKALQSKVAVLEAALEAKQDAMDCLYQVGTDVYVDGCNLHVRNGTGYTQVTSSDGLGNLIVGYNEDHPDGSEKTGSHNVIVGQGHTYTNHGGLVTGIGNTIAGPGAVVTGGWKNVANGWASSVSGGHGNEASGIGSSVSGGASNMASGDSSSVGGGGANTATGNWSTVSGGRFHVADHGGELLPFHEHH